MGRYLSGEKATMTGETGEETKAQKSIECLGMTQGREGGESGDSGCVGDPGLNSRLRNWAGACMWSMWKRLGRGLWSLGSNR